MQTRLHPSLQNLPEAAAARDLIAACVHCGFCNATCPTYGLLGDEADGPRGRIYLVKAFLEGDAPTRRTQTHLDRCLTCRACETTCPSGVRYGRLADLGRQLLERRVERPWRERLLRRLLRTVLPYPQRLRPFYRLVRWFRPVLPQVLQAKIGSKKPLPWPTPRHARRMLMLEGCVQSVLAAEVDAAAARVLDALGISLIRVKQSGCCGALSHHLAAAEEGLEFMRRAIDACWPELENGAEGMLVTSSGCGAMVREYGELLADDPAYAAKAVAVSRLVRDLSEILAEQPNLETLRPEKPSKLAFQSPCTLQHGLKLGGKVENILVRLGFQLTPVADVHECCGSAGAYSILQPDLAGALRDKKIAALESGAPDFIATANIGCLLYLRSVSRRPVVHWIELLADPCPETGMAVRSGKLARQSRPVYPAV